MRRAHPVYAMIPEEKEPHRTPSTTLQAAHRRQGPQAGPVHFIFTHRHLFSLTLGLIIRVVSD